VQGRNPPIRALPVVPAAAARRLLLDAQGLLAEPRRKATPQTVYELVERMGFVQVDSINVVARAQHLTLAARLDGYRPAMLERLLERERRLFEHWTHDAAAIPTVWYPYWRYRFAHAREVVLGNKWWMERLGGDPDGSTAAVLARIRDEGPLMAKDFERAPGADSAWWGWTRQKAALEFLWHTGALAITRRVQFHKVYDLAERVLPAAAEAGPQPPPEEYFAWACRAALERLGVATPQELADFWRAVPAAEARAWCERAAATGEIVPVRLEAADGSAPRAAYALPDWEARAATSPPAPHRLRLLSPFDPILHDRRRTQRLFGFDYRLEVFVPAAKRRHGYYVMPILEGERLVGRLDPKLHRDRGVLEVRGLWWEPGVRPSRARRAALEAAVSRLARLAGAERWTLPRGA
jgi:hypothetical protein